MPKTDEKLADILAEMRKAVVPMICGRPKIEAVSIGDVLHWADRIEAAAERERDDLVDAHDAIARFEAELAEVRRERDTIAAERAMDEPTRTHIPHETIDDVLGEMKRGLHYGRGYDIDNVNRFLRDWAVRIGIANERSNQANKTR